MASVDLPWDITTEIFSRLPVKSLMRFKCVSISFYNLISNDPIFRKMHFHHQSSFKKVILLPYYYGAIFGGNKVCPIVYLSPDLGDVVDDMIELKRPTCEQVSFHNSCDGLLCVSTSKGDVVIWNPSTRQVKKFQGCARPRPNIWIAYSLAHDPRSDIYKLLGLTMSGHNTYKLYFYSTETGKWRDIEDYSSRTHTCNYVEYGGKTTVVNGAFHWLGCNERHMEIPHVVVTLDISDETYGTLALPQAMCDNLRGPIILCEMKGKLCMMGNHTRKSCNWDIWVMNEYGDMDSMVIMLSMSLGELSRHKLSLPFHMLEDDTLVIYSSGNICFYKDGKVLRITRTGNSTNMSPYVYVESLISPHTCLQAGKVIVPNGFSGRGKHVVTWPRWCLQRLCSCGKSF